MSFYSDYQTSPEAETEGIEIDFGDFKMRCARAGGANKAYAKVMERKMRPHRHAQETDKLSEDTARDVLKQVFAETIVKDWSGEGTVGKDGQPMACTPENVLQVFRDLDLIFDRVYATVTKANRYLLSELEDDTKNS